MFSFIIIASQMLLVPAQDLSNIAPPTAAECPDPSALACLQEGAILSTPQGCGDVPASTVSGQVDEATLKWVQCACPKLTPILACLEKGAANCPPAKPLVDKYGPLVKSVCPMFRQLQLPTTATANNNTSTSTTTDATPAKQSSHSSGHLSASLVLVLVLGLLI